MHLTVDMRDQPVAAVYDSDACASTYTHTQTHTDTKKAYRHKKHTQTHNCTQTHTELCRGAQDGD